MTHLIFSKAMTLNATISHEEKKVNKNRYSLQQLHSFFMRYLQRKQTQTLCLNRDYNSKITLDPLCEEELDCWILQLRLSDERSVISQELELLIQAVASKTGWGAFLSEDINRRSMISSRKSAAYK